MSRVLIIGAGVIGLCSAYFAAKRGFKVTVIDRNPEDHPGCSYGNAGMIVPSHFIPLAAPGAVALGLKWMWNPESPFWIKPRLDWELFNWGLKFWSSSTPKHVRQAGPVLRDLHMASRAYFEEFAAMCGNEFGLVTRGLLMLCKTAHTLEEEGKAAEQARELEVPAEVLDAKQTEKLDPAVQMDITGAVYFPKDCHLTPQKFMRQLKKLAKEQGVEFRYGLDAQSARREGRRVRAVITNQGELESDEFVLAGGSWSPEFARELRLKLPMQAGKGYSLTLENPPQLPGICAILAEARVAVTPMGKTLRVGGTMEMAGLNEDINPVRVRGIVNAVPKYYPQFTPQHFAGIKTWCGLRPCSPDGLPYLGRSDTHENLIISTGHAMMGLSLGPASGKVVADLLASESPAIDIQMLRPNRFG